MTVEVLQSFALNLSSLTNNAVDAIDQNAVNLRVVQNILEVAGQFYAENRNITSEVTTVKQVKIFFCIVCL